MLDLKEGTALNEPIYLLVRFPVGFGSEVEDVVYAVVDVI